MSDRLLRELERRFRESGGLTERLVWLNARARAGELEPGLRGLVRGLEEGWLTLERLGLLAYLCVPAAQEVLGDDLVELAAYLGDLPAVRVVRGEAEGGEDVGAWGAGLAHWGPELLLPALTGVTRGVVEALAAEEPAPELHPDLPGFEAELGFLVERRQQVCRAAARALEAAERGQALVWDPPYYYWEGRESLLDEALRHAAWALRAPSREERREGCARWARACADATASDLPAILARVAPRLLERLAPPTG